MKINKVEDTAAILKLLGDKTRLTMLKMLQEKECCVCEFVALFDMSQPGISQHVKRLRDVKIIKERRSGQWIFYTLNKNSKYFPLIQDVLNHTPDQTDKLTWLDEQGLAITCE